VILKILFRDSFLQSYEEMKMKKYIIFGGGNFLSDIFDLIHADHGTVYKIYLNFPETRQEGRMTLKQRISLLDYDVEMYESLNSFEPEYGCNYVIGFVTVQKYRLIEELKRKFGITFCNLLHPNSYLGSNVHVGEGVLVSPGSVIAPNAYLDDFCAINRCVSIGHDTKIGKFTSLGPSVAIGGGTKIGDKCSIGIGAGILDNVQIGAWSVIGAGSVVTKNVQEGVVSYGIPAKVIRKNEDVDFEAYMSKQFHLNGD
jgi:sugar O-acyltransferase (sialic acid O-acetyltransferase NeuD family)